MRGGPGRAGGVFRPSRQSVAGSSTDCGEIWLHGFRNPFRWSFDRQTGDARIGDVGESEREEIDLRIFGSTDGIDYGWDRCEGDLFPWPNKGSGCPKATGTVAPVLEYANSSGCAVVGGYRYRGPIPALYGNYIYSDFCSSTVWSASFDGEAWQSSVLEVIPGAHAYVVSLGEDESGNLYVVDLIENRIYQFTLAEIPTHTVTPFATSGGHLVPAAPQVVNEGATIDFTIAADPHYDIDTVFGAGCDVQQIGNSVTVGPVMADCWVQPVFRVDPDAIFWDGFETPTARAVPSTRSH